MSGKLTEQEKRIRKLLLYIVREGSEELVEELRAVLLRYPNKNLMKALIAILEYGAPHNDFVCIEHTRFMAKTRKTFNVIRPILERLFETNWYRFTPGIPPKLCVLREVLECLKRVLKT